MTFSRILFIVALVSLSLQVAIAGEPVSIADNHLNKQVYLTWTGMDEGMTIYQENNQQVFEHIYPNIDLIVSGETESDLSYEFVVYPGGNPNDIQLADHVAMSSPEAFQQNAQGHAKVVETSFSKELTSRSRSIRKSAGTHDPICSCKLVFESQKKVQLISFQG